MRYLISKDGVLTKALTETEMIDKLVEHAAARPQGGGVELTQWWKDLHTKGPLPYIYNADITISINTGES